MSIIATVLLFAFLMTVGIVVQVLLSKCKSKYWGLVLPALSFLISWLVPLNMITSDEYTLMFWISLLFVFLIANVPTIVLLCIYWGIRQKRNRSSVDKMNIQDLG